MLRLLVLLGCTFWAYSASATTVTMNTDSARAVLDALRNPSLSHEASLKIAALPGNQGIIRKLNEFRIPANDQNFAEALYDAAHGEAVTGTTEQSFYFDLVKQKIPQLSNLLDEITADPKAFQQPIEQRIALFTPPGTAIHLQGYIIAGGDGGGYSFGDPNFFLNIGFNDEFVVAKVVTMHELYHAVQGAFAKDRGSVETPPSSKRLSRTQQSRANTGQLLANLYEEGSAMYVEDISLLQNSHSEIGRRQLADITDGLKHVHTSVSLLEMSILSLSASDAMPYDDVYEVGFYGRGILYSIGYVMAKAIAENDGPQGLAAHLKLPAYQFVLHYTELPGYGKDKDHPRLDANTLSVANQLKNGYK
jgi:hypothetical protein